MTGPISRRSFLMLPALAPLGVLASTGRTAEYTFHFDHIIGTSLDLAVWTPQLPESAVVAQRAAQSVIREIERLSAVLSTYDPESEIRRFERGNTIPSEELRTVLRLYEIWKSETGGVLSARPRGDHTPLNVDALGKAYIIDRAVAAARRAVPELQAMVLNIGGDIVVWGRECQIGIANPAAPHDNAAPLTTIALRNGAIATSGTYARGAHLIDARTGESQAQAASATVIATDAVTANALATSLCIMDAAEGLALVERMQNAEALRIEPGGAQQRTSGFARAERFQNIRQVTPAALWPMGFQVTLNVTLTKPNPPGDPPYLAAWVEDAAGKLVRAIVFWGTKAKYQPELSSFWVITGGSESLMYKVTRATRVPGTYKIAWNGLDDNGKAVPKGTYRIVVETNRYHGTYAKQTGMLACNDEPSATTLSGTTNFEPIAIQYGPANSGTK